MNIITWISLNMTLLRKTLGFSIWFVISARSSEVIQFFWTENKRKWLLHFSKGIKLKRQAPKPIFTKKTTYGLANIWRSSGDLSRSEFLIHVEWIGWNMTTWEKSKMSVLKLEKSRGKRSSLCQLITPKRPVTEDMDWIHLTWKFVNWNSSKVSSIKLF